MNLTRIDHIMVAIPEYGEANARVFYGNLLGLREIEKPATLGGRGGVWFETGSLQLHLGVDKHFVAATKAHVAFQVDDLKACKSQCVAAGYSISEDDALPGYERFYVNDPFGNRIEVLSPLA